MLGNSSFMQLMFYRTANSSATKMVRACFSMLLCGCLTISANAAFILSASTAPTTGLPGYRTDTLTATAAPGEKIIGFDFAGGGGTYGFIGAMNQVNPVGQPTVFQDNNPFFAFVGADVSQDSQFKVVSTKGIALGASESSTSLKAAFNYNAASVITDASNVWSFAQIVHAVSTSFQFLGTITVQNAQGANRLELVQSFNCLDCEPHPYAGDINNVIANNPGTVMGTFLAVNEADSWHDFMFQSYTPGFGGSGSGPAVPATFDPGTQKFSGTTIGSAPGTYRWQVSATNFYGTDSGSITVRIVGVPEPATLSLLGPMIVVGLGRTRRRHR